MSNPEQIEQEIREYLQIEANLRSSDKLAYLMTIVNKHFAIDKIDHTIDFKDLQNSVNKAKETYAKATIPMYISKREVHGQDINYVLVLESFIGYLNKNNLLKRLVKFDYGR